MNADERGFLNENTDSIRKAGNQEKKFLSSCVHYQTYAARGHPQIAQIYADEERESFNHEGREAHEVLKG